MAKKGLKEGAVASSAVVWAGRKPAHEGRRLSVPNGLENFRKEIPMGSCTETTKMNPDLP